MSWKENLSRVKSFVNPIAPPAIFHWKTLLLISIVIWGISFTTTDKDVQDTLAVIGLILLTISIGWRTSQPPFILGGVLLAPWITGTLVCLLIFQQTAATGVDIAIKSWPFVCGFLIVLFELIKAQSGDSSSPQIARPSVIILLLIHILLTCWVEFYLLVFQWTESNPNLLPKTSQPTQAWVFPHTVETLTDVRLN